MELPKAYDPKQVEDKIYQLWLESGFFSPKRLPRRRDEKFITCIAPPNITGELHLGHALEVTLQDIVVRMKRMQGYRTLWLPGLDHASIATQNVIEKQLAKEGLTRQQVGREEFLKRAWAWKEKYGGLILDQLKKLGLSLDWARERFTMDEKYSQAVYAAFKHYYVKGWLYQGERVVNWCPRCATSISDLEVNYVSEKGRLYFIKFGPFTLATARPETKLGDTGLAVHPDDPRYQSSIGQELEIETVDNQIPADQPPKVKKIKILVVADETVDPNFGTGIIKVTPAHDITDSEIGFRHNLPSLQVIDETGRMNQNAGLRYQGLKTGQAREKIVQDMQALGLIEKIDEYEHSLGRCDRCNSVIEPIPSKQWFLKMKELARLALKASADGQIKFYPPRWQGPFEHWLENIRDWNISRQLWWGHRLPVWFHEPKCIPIPGREEEIKECEEIAVSLTEPKCQHCLAKYQQSEDVLDTWFSSALWPLAALGWPASAEALPASAEASEGKPNYDFEEYYPTDLITSGREILYLWIARMVFSGIEFTGHAPFRNILIHATVLTKDGKRMSKSLGTGIDPTKLIEKYGTDALRFGLAAQHTGLQDLRFGEDLMVMGKKFANKVWNIARYIMLKTGNDYSWQIINPQNEMSGKIDGLSRSVTRGIEEYEFAEAANSLYHFIWHEFADKYLEETKDKDDLETKNTLAYVLITALKLLHPFMPFVTEEIYSNLPIPGKKLLIVENWPLA